MSLSENQIRTDLPHVSDSEIELTILMPCLNEEETLAICIEKAQKYLIDNNVRGEILIADNGSTDGSMDVARRHGVRVTHVSTRGYGAALNQGIRDARGAYIIMGDSDDSYDFSKLNNFLQKLREGHDLVMGNRFKGGIADGAMPPLHRYLGNPVLSFVGRLFFKIPIGDFHCGLRGVNRRTMLALKLHTTGMEFASEMIVRSALNKLSIAEVPVTLSVDGRSRPPHLRTWHDGWRHLRFLLMFSPRWLFLYPGLFIFGLGTILVLLLLPGPVQVAPRISLDIHSFIVACIFMLIGLQAISFAVIAQKYGAVHGLIPANKGLRAINRLFTLERLLILSAIILTGGLVGLGYCMHVWWQANLGALPYGAILKVLIISVTAIAIALQVLFTAFLMEILSIRLDSGANEHNGTQS